MAITNKEVTNKVDLIAPRHSAPANGCNWMALNEGGDSGQSVPYPTTGATHFVYLPKSTLTHTVITTPSNPHSITVSHCNAFTLDIAPNANDLIILDADPLAVFKLKKGDLTTGLSFDAINVKNLWLGNGGVNNGKYEQDLCVDLIPRTLSAIASSTNIAVSSIDLVGKSYTMSHDGIATGSTYIDHSFSDAEVLEPHIITITLTGVSGTCHFKSLAGANIADGFNPIVTDFNIGAGKTLTLQVLGLPRTAYGIGFRLETYGADTVQEACVVDVSGISLEAIIYSEIQAYTANCRTLHANTNLGVNNLKLTQDASGRATGYLGDGEMAFANADGRGLPLSLYLNEERYRFTEVIQLADTTKEYRVLEHDANTDGLGTEVNSLYVNGVLVSSSPTLPNPATLITLGDTAIIGNPDTVTRRYKAVNLDDATQPNVLSTDIKTAQDALDEYNAWLLLGY